MSNEKGLKYDNDYNDKPPVDLIPSSALFEIAKVLGFGAKKYSRAQWTGGIEYSRLIAAAQRHLMQFNSGEDIDNQSNLSHVAHAATNLCFLLWMIQNKQEMDDRWQKR